MFFRIHILSMAREAREAYEVCRDNTPPLGRSSYDVIRTSAGSISAVDTRFIGRRIVFLLVAGGNVRS